MSASGQKQTFRTAITVSALPLKADMCSAQADVRYVPIADMTKFYSITTSAVASSAGDIASPSALAAFRFMTSSYFVGACLSNSSHFAPMLYSKIAKPVILPPGLARLLDKPGGYRIAGDGEHDG